MLHPSRDVVEDDRTLNGDEAEREAFGLSDLRVQLVDVNRAEATFNELSRRLSQKSVSKDADLEKGKAAFDLREYLTSSNDAHQQAGIRHKHVGVTWDDLEVRVFGQEDSKIYVKTFGQAVWEFFAWPFILIWSLIAPLLPMKANEPPQRPIIHKQSGVLKPGQMCLVLGCPGAGCTTFLKTIANQREGYGKVLGDVRYAGIDAEEMSKLYRGEVVYNEEDDIHIATLTVAQTISFALSTKTPGPHGRLPGMSRKEFQKEVQDTLLKMLNISHTAQTLVGNEFVRGVSGGERKRVSIAEMMATRARVQCWDNSTRGLDASTALDFVKCLRIMTDILGQTTFVTLYQAGEGIYDLFDKVMVLDKGRQVFFGPPSEARAYFERLGYAPLPRQSTPDYLTGCTDPNERLYAPGRSAADVPSTPEALEAAFLASEYGRDLRATLEDYKIYMEKEKRHQEEFRAAVAADKKKGVSKKSPYTVGFRGQVMALTKRQFQMRLQDKFQLVTSFTLSTILALVIGAAYFDLPTTSAGAFTRGSVMFAAMLTVCLDCFGEMPVQMMGRPIMKKQTAYSFYRPAAIAVANTLSDIPFSAIRILIYNIIIYFMSNLHRSAGGFFVFHLFIYTAFLAMQGFFRTFGLICSNFDSAFRIAAALVTNLVQYVGYMIPVFDMKRWLFWIYYCNPMAYAFAGLMENEFMRIQLTCDGNYIAPRNPPGSSAYPNGLGSNQVCTLYGSSGGDSLISGRSYLDVGYGMVVSDIWRRNFLVVLGFFILFQVTQVLAIEYWPQPAGGSAISVYAKEDKETKRLNERLRQRKAERAQKKAEDEKLLADPSSSSEGQKESNKEIVKHRKTFTWEKLNYHVPVAGGSRRLLHDVYGYVKPGTLTALMGASGAGKTTCLDVLAQRKNIGVITGDILVDGRPLDSSFARGTAYAEQLDVHEGTATVREAMRFSAYLRQPASVPREEKDQYVEEMIELLELQDLSEALVMSLGVEARKRLTIGVELASKPELLLFLDEPTSGLDGQSAWNLVRFLRKLANNGQAILCTIHQPSSLLFESFDRLLLLQRGGETVYFGDIGRDASVIREYWARHGAVCPPNVNMAEYMLESIGAGVSPRVGDRDWAELWRESPECAKIKQEIEEIKSHALSLPPPEKQKQTTYATPFWYQLQVVVKRNSIALWRSADYLWTRLFVHAAISLFISLSFLQLGSSVRELQYRVFAIFWTSILPAIIMSQLQPVYLANRRIFIRESSSRIYGPEVFAIAQLLGEVPYSILCGVVYWVLMVYPIGFGQGATGLNGTGFQLLVLIFLELFGVTLGQLIAALSPSIQVAVLVNPFIVVVLGQFSGVTIPYPTLAKFWKSWLYQLDPYTRVLSAMLSTELHGLNITCRSDEFAIFNPPSGETCQSWANTFVQGFGGYLDNPNDTSACRYCQYRSGDEYFLPLNIRFDNRWRDAFILFAFFAFNFIATVMAARYLRYSKR
ncbi:hypothetical protein GLOTRDRAFT_67504 [Gloeophyllum trabeum ATCC 11539]|uniref:ABC transporter domain-containing protein n=1 Tax=Gloeophyllum trabeum (strain ATCC 11539 / FP-39264 / Madison 617) TaxID=670483 RepID=S7QLD4_GLOTA|nr:uncharacterized protein GLOTRDRAFT_67504 [Gloeophyllum trabeum ATCC 11539]EPQ60137.1 hypothetical protein GLOTRDRAFT_67504 [Gloeophyllum trabeum ATCC 11539]